MRRESQVPGCRVSSEEYFSRVNVASTKRDCSLYPARLGCIEDQPASAFAMDTMFSMKVFRQVVESGSFVAAAERLSLSTAMTSKHLMHLEKQLGSRLLNRNSRGLSLTEPGKCYLERCKVILEQIEEAELAVGSVDGAPRGVLRVTAPSWTETRPLMDMVATYRERYPYVVL